MVALALVFVFGGFCGHFCMYGCMDVWCYLHSFCVFGAFSRTMLALASLLLSCHTSVCLGALLNATHTPHNAGPRAMSRNTRQAMLDRIDRKRKRVTRVTASYTCDGGGGGGGGGGDRRSRGRRRCARSVVRSDRVWRRRLRSGVRLTGFWAGWSGWRPV